MSKTIIKKGIALFAALIIIGCNLIMVVEAATTPSTIEITGLKTQSQESTKVPHFHNFKSFPQIPHT